MNVILKSGGNDFHGGAFMIYTDPKWQSDNVDDELRAQGITSGNPIKERWDSSAELGGRVVRDRLWFYAQVRARRDDDYSLGGFNPDGSPSFSTQVQVFETIKISNQLSPSTKLVGFWNHLGQTGNRARRSLWRGSRAR